jgi:3-oxoadipate enol-lactonase
VDWIEVNGVSLRYEVTGDGPTLVLLHEIGGSLESWDALVGLLSSQFRVLRYDQRGAGFSEKVRQPFVLDDLVDDLGALLTALRLDGPVHLIGTALGAAQAVLFAHREPAAVASLVLLSPALDMDESRAAFMKARSHKAMTEGMRAVLSMTLDRAYPPEVRRDPAVFRQYRGRYLANDPHAFALMNATLTNVASKAEAIACPALVIAGDHDVVRPSERVRATADRIPGSTFGVIDAAHFIPVQAPEALHEQLVTFYRGVLDGATVAA